MNTKDIAFDIYLKSTKQLYSPSKQRVFTNDKNTAKLNFIIKDMTTSELANATAELLLYAEDGSFFEVEDITKDGLSFTHILDDEQRKHSGIFQTQLLVTIGTNTFASPIQAFHNDAAIGGDGVVDIVVPSWDVLRDEIQTFILDAQSNEETRKTDESTRKTNETTRISNENSRKSAETIRGTNENTRIQNETNKEQAETIRKSNEVTRQANEVTRVSNENARKSSETVRGTNETTRKTNETARQTNETLRGQNEDTREANETIRINAADALVQAESTRVSNENTRKTQETTRQTNETNRKTAETNRVNAESIRGSNETVRQSGESQRDQNEIQRQLVFDDVVGRFEDLDIADLATLDYVNTEISNLEFEETFKGLEADLGVMVDPNSSGRIKVYGEGILAIGGTGSSSNRITLKPQYATQTEAKDGTVSSKLMNPLRTKEAIDSQVPQLVNKAHIQENIDNLILSSYAEKLVNISSTSGTINLDLAEGNVFFLQQSGSVNLNIINQNYGSGNIDAVAQSFTLVIESFTSTGTTTFPAEVVWGENIPSINDGMIHILTFVTYGAYWFGMLAGEF